VLGLTAFSGRRDSGGTPARRGIFLQGLRQCGGVMWAFGRSYRVGYTRDIDWSSETFPPSNTPILARVIDSF
jgi:hypothetical protein